MENERNVKPLPCDGTEEFVITGDCLDCDYFDFCTKLKDEIDKEIQTDGQYSPYTG